MKRKIAVGMATVMVGGLVLGPAATTVGADQVRVASLPPAGPTAPKLNTATPIRTVEMAARLNSLPLQFEPNVGQASRGVKFLTRTPQYRLALTPTEAIFDFRTPDLDMKHYRFRPKNELVKARAAVEAGKRLKGGIVRMKLIDGRADARMESEGRLPGIVSHFRGNDPSKWVSGVPTFRQVRSKDVYPGIDIVYYGTPTKLEYDVVVAPGADPHVVNIAMEGVDRVEVAGNGDLVLHAAGQQLRHQRPVAYQVVNGERRPIDVSYVVKDGHRVGFQVREYQRNVALVIDPVVDLGGGFSGRGDSVAIDAAQNSYITGIYFPNCPGLINEPDVIMNDPLTVVCLDSLFNSDVFVQKIDVNNNVVWTTTFGGSATDIPYKVVVDTAGNPYVVGQTNSQDFPLLNAFQSALGGPEGFRNTCQLGSVSPACSDIFIIKLRTTPTTPCASPSCNLTTANISNFAFYSTYVGGPDQDAAFAVDVDSAGNAYVTGTTTVAPGFPPTITLGAATINGTYAQVTDPLVPDPTPDSWNPNISVGESDAFIARVNTSGQVTYFTYSGGNYTENGIGITVDALGNVSLVTEVSQPTAYLELFAATAPVGTVEVAGDETTMRSRIAMSEPPLRPSAPEAAGFMTMLVPAPSCAATASGCEPLPPNVGTTSNALQASFNGGTADTMIVRAPAASGLVNYKSFLGGDGQDLPVGISSDAQGNLYIAGSTTSTNFVKKNEQQGRRAPAGFFSTFVTKIGPPTTTTPLAYSTYLDGADGDSYPTGIAVTPTGVAVVSVVSDATDTTVLPPAPEVGVAQVVVVTFGANTETTAPPVNTIPVGTDGTSTGLGVAVSETGQISIAGASGTGLGAQIADLMLIIDIKPSGPHNRINWKSKGKVRVAILSTPTMDATKDIDISTVKFGRTGTEESRIDCKKSKDVNKDKRKDLICRFYTSLTGFQTGDTQGQLSADLVRTTVDPDTEEVITTRTNLFGIDIIKIVPAKVGKDKNDVDDEDATEEADEKGPDKDKDKDKGKKK